MGKVPLVSVLCITMNHAPFVEKAYKSLINQSFRDFEIVYVDNNSSDDSYNIADRIFSQSGLPYRKFRRSENYGISANMNFLINQSKGEYISALSGDDFWEQTHLEEKMNFYSKHPEFGMIYGAGYNYFHDTAEAVLMEKTNWKSGWVFKDLLEGNFINAVGFIIKKSTLDVVGLYDSNAKVEDWELWIRIAVRYQIGFFEKPLVYYGQRTGNNASANIEYMDSGAEYIFNKYAHHKEMTGAKKKYRLYRVYQIASEKPTLKNLLFILKNSQFNFIYLKQVFKFFAMLFSFKSR